MTGEAQRGVSEVILARLDEWEAAAKAATPGPWVTQHGIVVWSELDTGASALIASEMDRSNALHVIANQPAAVLAMAAGLRGIVERCRLVLASWDAMHGGDPTTAMWPDVNRRERSHAYATLDLIAAMWPTPAPAQDGSGEGT